MKLQNLTVIFIIITIPIILLISFYISNGLRTIEYQSLYDNGLLNATYDTIYAFEQNTANDKFSGNPEEKREIIKASIKMFEKSLCVNCNISAYNTDEVEQYIPAIVFGMYDGFYMYAPSKIKNQNNEYEYKHNLKNYIYYSETLKGIGHDNSDVSIRYSLDNYVVVSGNFGSGYETRNGYLITKTNEEGTSYNGTVIKAENINGENNTDAIQYYKEGYQFTKWFNEKIGENVKDENDKKYLLIDVNVDNNPEDEDSLFSQHKRQVIKDKITSVLNSSITAYSNKTYGRIYKMPKLSEDDWEKIYSNISVITFFQGKNIGYTKYNGYCVLNSTNNQEYVNPNLMYFIDESGDYHDIRCDNYESASTLIGYKIGDFEAKRIEKINKDTNEIETDANGNTLYEYIYEHKELACYNCVNGQINTTQSVYDFINANNTEPDIKTAYWSSLGRERYNTTKLLVSKEKAEELIREPDLKYINSSGKEFYGTNYEILGESKVKGGKTAFGKTALVIKTTFEIAELKEGENKYIISNQEESGWGIGTYGKGLQLAIHNPNKPGYDKYERCIIDNIKENTKYTMIGIFDGKDITVHLLEHSNNETKSNTLSVGENILNQDDNMPTLIGGNPKLSGSEIELELPSFIGKVWEAKVWYNEQISEEQLNYLLNN